MDEMTISIGDLLAVLARKGKQIICCGILFAILLGCFKGFMIWRNMNDPEYINLDQVAYEQEKLNLERMIETAERGIANQESYITNSLWMDINPYAKHTTKVYLMVSGINESEVTMTFGDTTTPRDYMLGEIMAQYNVFWSAEDLAIGLALPQYEGVLDKYLRELVSVSFLSDGVIQVTAIGNSDGESAELANAATDLLLSKYEIVKANAFNHTIDEFNTVHLNQIDTGMAEAQYAHYVQIDTYNSSIIEAKEEIKDLEEPDSIPVAIIKMVLIGGILGGVLACGWYVCKSLMTGLVQSSAQMEQTLSVPFTGTLAKGKGLFQWLSDLFSGERVWKNEEEALAYIVGLTMLRLTGKRLLLASTLRMDKQNGKVEKLRAALTAAGIQTDFIGDVIHNPGTLGAINGSDGVLLLEQVDQTKLDQAHCVCDLAEECKKPVIGFVLV